jgi:hypothetical protein
VHSNGLIKKALVVTDISAPHNVYIKKLFLIDERYGEYRIVMYYDNCYNQANGEDL